MKQRTTHAQNNLQHMHKTTYDKLVGVFVDFLFNILLIGWSIQQKHTADVYLSKICFHVIRFSSNNE